MSTIVLKDSFVAYISYEISPKCRAESIRVVNQRAFEAKKSVRGSPAIAEIRRLHIFQASNLETARIVKGEASYIGGLSQIEAIT